MSPQAAASSASVLGAFLPRWAIALMNPRVFALVLTTWFPFLTLYIFSTGAWKVGKMLVNFLRVLVQLFLWPGTNLSKYGAKRGAWAVVTGATDGIGKEFAFQLARKGFNIVLVSRTPEKLASVAAEISSQSPNVQTQTFAIDFAQADDKAYSELQSLVAPLEIGVLVNNVGRSHDIPTPFAQTSISEINAIVSININSVLRVTSIILPGMIDRKCGLILNLGSFAGTIPSALLATYSGSKAFLVTWTQALGKELEGSGVSIRVVNTYFVVSAMSKIRKSSIMVPTPRAFVRSVLSHINLACGSVGRAFSTTPYWSHAILDYLIETLEIKGIAIRVNYNIQKTTRARALARRERELKAQKKE